MSDAPSALDLTHDGWQHLKLQRPLAAWASWNQALRADPNARAAAEALERLQNSDRLPALARGPHRFRPAASDEALARWSSVMGRVATADDLGSIAAAFQEIVEETPTDCAAWFNRALCLAWLGKNVEAIEALNELVERAAERPADQEMAIEGWMMGEILRQGAGAEALADDVGCTLELRWPEELGDPEAWLEERAAVQPVSIGMHPGDDQPSAMILEWLDRGVVDPTRAYSGADLPRVLASVALSGDALTVVSQSAENARATEAMLEEWLGLDFDVLDRRSTPLPIEVMDLAAWRFRMPDDLPAEERQALTRAAIESFYDSSWIDQPRLGLVGLHEEISARSPRDAAALAGREGEAARLRLEGVLRLREQLLRRSGSARLHGGLTLDFLRTRLGLESLESHERA